MIEYFFMCPYCFQQISMLVDPSIAHQQYIEDCEVCCRPIEIQVTVEEQEVVNFQAERTE